jgi:hypothetical protein
MSYQQPAILDKEKKKRSPGSTIRGFLLLYEEFSHKPSGMTILQTRKDPKPQKKKDLTPRYPPGGCAPQKAA